MLSIYTTIHLSPFHKWSFVIMSILFTFFLMNELRFIL
ncbi:hypothetical protein B4110_3043 [Parageobacillus toebii]|uniref:Uncharacterized protein n=1 Tax=Parageobacillus toebii TaxID=153151 RepID=A0A150MXL0_9BACL|nr:hypothetical protein B4110_3043 [Parageobacillus toebii]